MLYYKYIANNLDKNTDYNEMCFLLILSFWYFYFIKLSLTHIYDMMQNNKSFKIIINVNHLNLDQYKTMGGVKKK